jgi:GH15 family glucan-1,4-alpha-glucosidase
MQGPNRRSEPWLRPPATWDYGIIGDLRTAALVSLNGAIDWCCLPRFDSGSVFAAILDGERGGTWAIRPRGECPSTQRYLPRTNVLETTFRSSKGVVVLEQSTATALFDNREGGGALAGLAL